MKNITYEVFPRSINDISFILTSIKNELNGLISINCEYSFKFVFFRNKSWIYLKQYISSNSDTWILFLLNFYEKLYSWNIAFKRVKENLKFSISPKHYYSVWLENNHVFQIKKPGEIGLNTFSSSAWLIENILNESALILNQWEFIQFEFIITPNSYDQFSKAFLYTVKEIWKSEEYKEELRWSFTDKLGFFLFDFNISHNLENEKNFWNILYKNLRLYDSNWNNYNYKYSNKNYPKLAKRYRKWQIDMFLAHGLVSLISENNRYIQKLPSTIIPISPILALNNGTGKNKWEYKTFIWKWFKDLRLNNQEYLSFDKNFAKNNHSIIIWGTWSWKSYTTSQVIGFDIIKSITNDRINFEKFGSPRSQFIFIDPHFSLALNIYKILEIFNKDKNYKYNSEFQVIEYQKEYDDKDIINHYLPIKKIKLTFNPLFWDNLNISDLSVFLNEINKMTSACLDGIRATHSKASFWPQNSDILSTIIRLFIIFNALRNEANKKSNNKAENYKRILNLGDIHSLLEELEINKSLPDWLREDFKNSINCNIWEIENIVKSLKRKIDYYLEQLKKNTGYLSSSINKVAVYWMELKETFWNWTLHTNYSLNLTDFFIKKDYNKTNIHFFNLWEFSINEKNIVAGFILSYMYHYWTTRNHIDKKDLIQTSIIIDEASAILNGEYILEIIASSLAEIRKYGFSLNFLFQSIDQKAFALIYPNIWYMFVFSVDYRQAEVILDDLNSWCSGKIIQPNDIINNQRWRFYAFFKFVNGWNSTLLIEWFWMNENEIKYLIS
ncbi:MAG: hypothetical protein ACD_49C00064G0023 [uncultured bacterium (gcode 4)]|uniref:Uncharacterized protein n=1 Tax=uncultured bacterium (gcode 4) TaxID=1234023 RepID=K2ADL0_9BACT|nr:MAG: hypothetical protein ACD_49C00064G0023 [uncultured bacterium (gcode 4)]